MHEAPFCVNAGIRLKSPIRSNKEGIHLCTVWACVTYVMQRCFIDTHDLTWIHKFLPIFVCKVYAVIPAFRWLRTILVGEILVYLSKAFCLVLLFFSPLIARRAEQFFDMDAHTVCFVTGLFT